MSKTDRPVAPQPPIVIIAVMSVSRRSGERSVPQCKAIAAEAARIVWRRDTKVFDFPTVWAGTDTVDQSVGLAKDAHVCMGVHDVGSLALSVVVPGNVSLFLPETRSLPHSVAIMPL